MGIRIYTEKTKVNGSLFQEYAMMSKLSGNYLIKHIRFIDPIIDDDGNIFPFVRKDHIIFIAGLAVSVKSLVDFLEKVIDEAYTDYPAALYVKKDDDDDPLRILMWALERIDVITIQQFHASMIRILPKEEKSNSPWSNFFNLVSSVGYSSNEINFIDEITDFD